MKIRKISNAIGLVGTISTDLSSKDNNAVPTCKTVSDALSYSTEEHWTGKYWIDGKKIYSKVINFGAMPKTTTKTVAHGISNIDFIVNYEAIMSDGSTFFKLPLTSLTNIQYQTRLSVDKTNLSMQTGADLSNYTTTYITIEYTKTNE